MQMEAGTAPASIVSRPSSGLVTAGLVSADERQNPRLALLRRLVVPLVIDVERDLLLTLELESLCPILGLFRQAAARPCPTDRLYFDELFVGRRRSARLALVECAGLESLLTPLVGPDRSLVERQRNSWLPRFVNLAEFILLWPPLLRPLGLPILRDGTRALISGLRRVTVLVPSGAPAAFLPVSLPDACNQRPLSSLLFLSAQSSKSSPADAGEAEADSRSRRIVIDTPM
jgi:hypothetical protein